MRSIHNRPSLGELEVRRQINGAGLNNATKAVTGMSAKMLNAHLQVAEALLRNDTSLLRDSRVRAWLHRQAEASGRSRAEVDSVIKAVLSEPTGEAKVRRYSVALSGDPGAAERGLGLATHYQRFEVAEKVNNRLERQAEQLRRSGSTFELPDTEGRFAKERAEAATGVRAALEKAVASSGLSAGRPQSLSEYQQRASAYAEGVANRLEDTERRRQAGQPIDLREDIRNQWEAAKALEVKHDTGLGVDRSLGDVIERSDMQSAALQSTMSDVENQ